MRSSKGLFFEKIDAKVDSTISGWARFIDNGSFFKDPISVIYRLIAVGTISFPLYLLLKAYDVGFLSPSTEHKLLGLAALLIVLSIPICWVCGCIWWFRSRELDNITKGETYLVATPIFAHLLRTSGESYGVLFGLLGLVVNIFLAIFDVDLYMFRFIDYGTKGVLICPVVGYLIVIISRFLSEIVQASSDALSSKINNEKKDDVKAMQNIVDNDNINTIDDNADADEQTNNGKPILPKMHRVLNLKVISIVIAAIICVILLILLVSGHSREASTKSEEELLLEQATKNSEKYDFKSEEGDANSNVQPIDNNSDGKAN